MGRFTDTNPKIERLLKIVAYYEGTEGSSGYISLDRARFNDEIMFYESFVWTMEDADWYWGILKDLGIIKDLENVPYLDVGRMEAYCKNNNIDLYEKNSAPVVDVSYDLQHLQPVDHLVLGIVKKADRNGMSFSCLEKLAKDICVEPEVLVDSLTRLSKNGYVYQPYRGYFKVV